MTIHYHGTPITPRAELLRLAGRHFCVSFADKRDAEICHGIGQSVMLDNGAYSHWRSGQGEFGSIGPCQKTRNSRATLIAPRYRQYVEWALEWTAHQTTWCVIPDAITGDAELNQRLVDEWPKNEIPINQAAPVWHLHEPIDRLRWLIDLEPHWPRICIGSSGDYATPGSDKWHRRMDTVFNRISDPSGRIPVWLHMLRGMSLCESYYPFASVDSTDVAQNYKRSGNIVAYADKWDGIQCPAKWHAKMEQHEMLAGS